MLDTAKQLFDSLKTVTQAIAPGLQNLGPELVAESSRLATQGSMELASALFGGSGFVPYGPGQYTPSLDQQRGMENELEPSRGGMER